jgi:hypothetical protein
VATVTVRQSDNHNKLASERNIFFI